MVRRRSVPRTLQRNCFARVLYGGNADEILISRYASGWVKIDPAGARYVNLNPSVRIAANNIVLFILFLVIIIDQVYVSGYESRRDPARAKCRDHKDGDVATTSTP